MLNFIFIRKTTLALIKILIFIPFISFSQESVNSTTSLLNELHKQAEDKYGLDDRLVNGTIYRQKNPYAKGHPYFLDEYWKNSTLFINGLTFPDLQLNYNIDSDEIILNLNINNELSKTILLKTILIDSLIIEDHFFINATTLQIKNISGFYERIHKGSFNAYFKHSIELEDVATFSSPNGEYKKPIQTLYIMNAESGVFKLQNKKSLLNHFSEHKKGIKAFLRKNNIFYNRIKREQLIKLLKYCDEISSK